MSRVAGKMEVFKDTVRKLFSENLVWFPNSILHGLKGKT